MKRIIEERNQWHLNVSFNKASCLTRVYLTFLCFFKSLFLFFLSPLFQVSCYMRIFRRFSSFYSMEIDWLYVKSGSWMNRICICFDFLCVFSSIQFQRNRHKTGQIWYPIVLFVWGSAVFEFEALWNKLLTLERLAEDRCI